MKLFLSAPAPDDLVRLLRAWRIWLLGAVAGALIGTAAYFVTPPPYRVRATVNVDFHLEQAWPQNTDREQFYYLERETRKLEEIAMSDATLSKVASEVAGVTVGQLRAGRLELSQPGNGGWHFYAIDNDPNRAASLASAWATAFAAQVQEKVSGAAPGGLEPYITADPTQTEDLIPEHAASLGAYVLVGAVVVLALTAIGVLFLRAEP